VTAILLAPGGVLLAWASGFLLSSGNSHCTDGVRGGACSGSLASHAWHYTGIASLVVAAVMIVAALWLVTHTCRQDRIPGQ
jgi:hypothetical protein